MPYNRCLIADFLGGSRTQTQVHTKGEQFFVDNNIELMLDCEVISMNVDAKTVMLHNGTTLSYDALLIATGRSAFVPSDLVIPGMSFVTPDLDPGRDPINSPPIFPFYDLSHAQNILEFIDGRPNLHALVVGGGISGLECADALIQRGVKITMIERGQHLLPRQMDEGGAQFLQNLMSSQGVTVYCSTTIKEIEKKNKHNVALNNNKSLEVDLIIAATGGRQNLQFAQEAGINCDEFGIIVDQYQATNFDEIYAAGDVCSVNDLLTGKPTSSTLWPDAVAQGLSAAHSIALYLLTSDEHARLPSKPYAGTLNITSTNIFGTTLVTGGDFGALENVETLTKQEDGFYHCLYVKDGILQGFVMVGNVTGVGQLRKAMIDKTRIV